MNVIVGVSGQLPTGTILHRIGIGPDEWFLLACGGPVRELS